MTKQLSNHAAAAKQIRDNLKERGIKASVRASSYAGGSSVDVYLKQDMMPDTRQEIEVFCKRFQFGHFDGMTDCYNYSNVNDDLPQVQFVFVNGMFSAELRAEAKKYIGAIIGIEDHRREHYEYMALKGTWGDFWEGRSI